MEALRGRGRVRNGVRALSTRRHLPPLGGGFGNLPRYFGLTADAIQEVDIVTADGSLKTVNKDKDPDLYWALRGGGGGASFGIVTRFKFALQPAPPSLAISTTVFPAADFIPVFLEWQRIFSEGAVPNTINSMFTKNKTHINLELVEVYPKGGKTNGGPTPKPKSLIPGILAKFPTKSVVESDTKVLSYSEYLFETAYPFPEFYNMSGPQDFGKVNRHSFNVPEFAKTKSFFSGPKPLTSKEALSRIVEEIGKQPEGGAGIIMEAMGKGSAINSIPATATAYVHRNSIYHATVGFKGNAEAYYKGGGKKSLDNFYNLMLRELGHKESYQNYADADLENSLGLYYGDNLRRLVALKKAVDPDNYFHSPETIPLSI